MFLVTLAVAALLGASTQNPVPSKPSSEPVTVEDVIVNGRRFEETAGRYVSALANPAGTRGLARWHGGVCVGIVNLRHDVAQPIIDRMSETARSLGLRSGEPGCRPNVTIAVSDDPSTLAASMVDQSFRSFHTGGSGTDQGRAKLQAFIHNDRPVRWWHLSYPGNTDTGEVAVRLPGYYNINGMQADGSDIYAYAPSVRTTSASRLRSAISDYLFQVVIIVDVDQVSATSNEQLSDYLAMIALAQIDPEGQTQGFSTILNLFDDAVAAPPGLTGWDRAYLTGLYQSDLTRIQIGNQHAALTAAALAARSGADRAQDANRAQDVN